MYVDIHGVPRTNRFDQAKSLVEKQKKTKKNSTDTNEAPVNDHRAMGAVARFIQNIKNILTCFTEGRSATDVFNIKQAFKIIIH